jgi:hypothetical protein
VLKSGVVGLAAVALSALVAGGRADRHAPPAAASLESLAQVFSGTGSGVADVNHDGLPDDVTARIIVPAAATSEDVEAAANIAGRLGYETTSLTLPLVFRDSDVPEAPAIRLPILVGRENSFVRRLVERGVVDLGLLRPGQGIIALVPSPLGGRSGLVVAGADDAGTLAAGVELGARVPRLWNMTGVTLGAIEQHVRCRVRSHTSSR